MLKREKINGFNYVIITDNKTFVKVGAKTKNKRFWGVARCHEDDVFDYEKGKELALARCDCRLLWDKMISMQKDMTDIQNTIDYLVSYKEKLSEHELDVYRRHYNATIRLRDIEVKM